MNKLTDLHIRTESLPIRCEVCHQTDCFEPDQNWCSRCKGLSVRPEGSQKEIFIKVTASTTKEIIFDLMKVGLITGGFGFLIAGFIWASAAEASDTFLVLAILSLVTGVVAGLIFGLVFLLGIVVFNAIEQIKWRVADKQHPLRQV